MVTPQVPETSVESYIKTEKNLPYARQKKHRIRLTKFCHEDENFVKQEYLLEQDDS